MEDITILSQVNLTHWVIQSIAMGLTAFLLPGLRVTGLFGGALAVLALAFVNTHLWDAALFFHVPDHFSTQAGLIFLANGLIFWIIVKLLPGIEVDGFLPALAAPLIFTVTGVLIDKYLPLIDWNALWVSIQSAFHKVRSLVSEPQSGLFFHGRNATT